MNWELRLKNINIMLTFLEVMLKLARLIFPPSRSPRCRTRAEYRKRVRVRVESTGTVESSVRTCIERARARVRAIDLYTVCNSMVRADLGLQCGFFLEERKTITMHDLGE